MGLSPKQQWSIRRANRRINLWHGSVRSSKTVACIHRWLQYIGDAPPGDLLMIGKTIDSLKRNVLNPLMELVGSDAQYSPGRRELKLWDRRVYTVGASDERSEGKIRGMTCAGAKGDEISLWPESFFNMLLSRMSVERAQFFGSTNPDNPQHWLKKKFINRKKELDMALFHFKLEDNPYLPKSYVESLKKEYVGLWYKRFIDGIWCVAEGAIYDFFDEKIHVIQKHPEATHYTVSYDYGTTNPTAFLLFGHNANTKPKVWAEREYYWNPGETHRQKTDAQFVEDFKTFIAPIKNKIRGIYGDPAAESFNLALKRAGIAPLFDANNEVLDGIRTVGSLLYSQEYAIYKACKQLIIEKCSYAWDEKAADRGEDKPIKKYDHCSDAERYDLHSQFGVNGYDITKFTS